MSLKGNCNCCTLSVLLHVSPVKLCYSHRNAPVSCGNGISGIAGLPCYKSHTHIQSTTLHRCWLVVGWLQKLETVEAGVEMIQTDMRQLTNERENIRSTFDDLTLKVIRTQVTITIRGVVILYNRLTFLP